MSKRRGLYSKHYEWINGNDDRSLNSSATAGDMIDATALKSKGPFVILLITMENSKRTLGHSF